jgi:prenyltransferase beta subunit
MVLRKMTNTEKALNNAILWLSTAPIRAVDAKTVVYGAFLHGVNGKTGKTLGVYTEITGYATSLFTFLNQKKGEPHFLEVAKNAADFLIRVQTDEGAYPDWPDPQNKMMPLRLYSFDTAMCVVGMARLAKLTKEQRYVNSALVAGHWLLSMQREDGSFHAMAVRREKIPDPGPFGDGSCIHAKNAMALLELYGITGEDKFKEAAIRVCDYTTKLQAADGAFWNMPYKQYVFTHAHCYASEGLLYAGHALGEKKFMHAAQRGIEWLARNQQSDGGWRARYKVAAWSRQKLSDLLKRPKHCDAAAQAARLFRLMGTEYETPYQAAVCFLLQCQTPEGGFFYWKCRLGYSSVLYTWCTQFAVQALLWNDTPPLINDLF